jgi:hypothetical protein
MIQRDDFIAKQREASVVAPCGVARKLKKTTKTF